MSGGNLEVIRGARLVFVFQTYALGGSERQALLHARYFQEGLGAEVLFVSNDAAGPVRDEAEALGIPCRTIPFKRPSGSLRTSLKNRRFAAALRALKPDLLLPVTITPNVVCGLVWRRVGARGSIWRQADAGLSLRATPRQVAAVRESSHHVANSPVAASAFARVYRDSDLGAPPFDEAQFNGFRPPSWNMPVIPNGVAVREPEHHPASVQAELGIAADAPVVTMVGNLTQYKDHETLLRAWAAVHRELPAAHLLLAGRDGGREAGLRHQAEAAGIRDHVHFLGFVADVPRVLAASTVVVLSSRSESCPGSLLEAMALGVPVVATEDPGTRFVLGDLWAAEELPPPGDADALARVLCELVGDPERRAELARGGPERIREAFSIEKMTRAWAELVAEALT